LRRYGLVKKLHRAAARGRHHRRAGGRLRRRSAGSAVLGVTRSRPRRARRAPADMRLVQCADRCNTDTPSSGPAMLPNSPMLLHRDDHTPLLQCAGCRVCACVGHRCQTGKRPGLAYPSCSDRRAVRGWRADRRDRPHRRRAALEKLGPASPNREPPPSPRETSCDQIHCCCPTLPWGFPMTWQR
jgi:hypothetical protein